MFKDKSRNVGLFWGANCWAVRPSDMTANWVGVRGGRWLAAVLLGWMLAAGAAMQAQGIVGTWQGTLPGEKQQRIMLKVSKAEDGSLRASCYQLGTGYDGLPMTSVKFAAGTISTEQSYAAMSYTGKLSEDGKSIEGTWTLGKQNSPLKLELATAETMWTPDYGGVAAMAADADPSFEVATVKLTPPEQQGGRYGVRTRNFKAVNQSVSQMICFAYHLQPRQIEGAPSWMDTVHFDLAGKPDLPGQPSEEQYRLMLRKLLAERFALKEHMVDKVVPVYAMTAEKNPLPLPKSDLSMVGYHNSILMKQAGDGQLQGQFSFFTMHDFADWLMNFIRDRQVVDETGEAGVFDITLKIPMDSFTAGSTPEDRGVALIEAVKPLGLKLVAKKEAIAMMEVEKVEKPSEN